jgi:nucleoid DNA-binding protein
MANKQVTLTKDAIVTAVAASTGLTKAATDNVFNAILEQISTGLVEGKSVRLAGIGSLTTKQAAARTCRNVHTGGSIDIPARRTVKFSVASDLKASVAAS